MAGSAPAVKARVVQARVSQTRGRYRMITVRHLGAMVTLLVVTGCGGFNAYNRRQIHQVYTGDRLAAEEGAVLTISNHYPQTIEAISVDSIEGRLTGRLGIKQGYTDFYLDPGTHSVRVEAVQTWADGAGELNVQPVTYDSSGRAVVIIAGRWLGRPSCSLTFEAEAGQVYGVRRGFLAPDIPDEDRPSGDIHDRYVDFHWGVQLVAIGDEYETLVGECRADVLEERVRRGRG